MKSTNLLINFLPMIIFYLVATYSSEMAKWSHTIIGKIIAIVIILVYVFTDIISGLLACAIVVFYYQSDYVEEFSPFLKELIEMKDKEIIQTQNDQSNLLSFNDAYPLESTIKIVNDKNVNEFRQKHCKKGHLIHKGQIVKPEMAQHIFPEIEQNSFNKCNICEHECSFALLK